VKQHQICYFIYRSAPLSPVDIERWGSEHVRRAQIMLSALLPKSHRIMTDPFGISLYEINEAQ
jgi:hypothetical protein